jgi:regulator of replication initiation timing
LNEELEHLRHMGGRIIAEKTEGLRLENRMLREELAKVGVDISQQSSPG